MERHVFLTGFMGAGKTSVATLLAERLACVAYDLDAEISAAEGKGIKELFFGHGTAPFRVLESRMLRHIIPRAPGVVATGGGVVLDPANIAAMSAAGHIVNLDASALTCWGRLCALWPPPERPPFMIGRDITEFVREWEQRAPRYAALPYHIDTEGCSVSAVVEAALALVASL